MDAWSVALALCKTMDTAILENFSMNPLDSLFAVRHGIRRFGDWLADGWPVLVATLDALLYSVTISLSWRVMRSTKVPSVILDDQRRCTGKQMCAVDPVHAGPSRRSGFMPVAGVP
jgi:hypothetical protein